MTDQELLQAIRTVVREEATSIVKEELGPINERLTNMDKRLNGIDEQLEILEEKQDEIRSGVNTLLDWAERSSQRLEFPLPKVIE